MRNVKRSAKFSELSNFWMQVALLGHEENVCLGCVSNSKLFLFSNEMRKSSGLWMCGLKKIFFSTKFNKPLLRKTQVKRRCRFVFFSKPKRPFNFPHLGWIHILNQNSWKLKAWNQFLPFKHSNQTRKPPELKHLIKARKRK